MNKLFIVFLLLSQLAQASQFIEINQGYGIKNPQIRVCREVGGIFGAYDVANDNVSFCSLGAALIGANDLVIASQGITSSAVRIYLNNTATGVVSCAQAGGSDQRSPSVNGIICQFSDNSWISLATLSQGKNSAMNLQLNRALNQLGL